MYRGFNVSINNYNPSHYSTGLRVLEATRESTIKKLDKFVGVDGTINGSDLGKNWFGEIDAHIFLSHSHADEKIAVALAGLLYTKHGITCFIDSCVWGYANELLREIDNKYCKNTQSNTYNYDIRNFSTSHVHMMLASALSKMIDNCECLFFLNTPNSVNTSEIVDQTYSPWIYSEMVISKLIEKKSPRRHRVILKERREISKAEDLNELRITHDLDLTHLVNLSEAEVNFWALNSSSSPENALDNLYKQKPATPRNRIL